MTAPLVFEDVSPAPGIALDLSVAANQTVAVSGDSRHGIDLLGEFALGLTNPPAGRCITLGQDPALLAPRELRALRRRIGYLPAGDGLLQNLSLLANVALPLRFGSRFTEREISARVGIILAQLGIADCAGQRPAAVTAEQRRRAGVARALAFDPELVIVEQPFEGLSSRVASELLDVIRGGELEDGSRRAVLILGRQLPPALRHRVEVALRISRGSIVNDTG